MAEAFPGAPRDRDGGVDGAARIVRIQQERVAVEGFGDGGERLLLRREELDQRMRDGAGGEQAIVEGGGEERRAADTADVRRARDDHRILRAAKGELGDAALLCRPDDARRLGGDQRGEVDRLEQPRLHQDGLAEGRGDAQQRLIGEGDRALRHGEDLAREAQVRQFVQKRGVVVADAREELQLVGAIAKRLHEFERSLKPGEQQVRAAEWGRAHVEVEGGETVAARNPTDVRRVGMVHVGEEAGMLSWGAAQHGRCPFSRHGGYSGRRGNSSLKACKSRSTSSMRRCSTAGVMMLKLSILLLVARRVSA